MPQIIRLGSLTSQFPDGTAVSDGLSPLELGASGFWRANTGITQSSLLVSAWTSIEGNSRVLAASGTARPTYLSTGIGAQPGLSFDGVANCMRMASWLGGAETEITMLIVFRLVTAAANKYWVSVVETGSNHQGGGDWIVLNTDATSKWTTRLSAPAGNSDATVNLSDTLAHLETFLFQGGTKVSLRIDEDEGNSDTTSIPASIDLDGFVELGGIQGTRVSVALPANVVISEFAIIPRALTDWELSAYRAYARERYELYWPITITEVVPEGGLHNAFPSLCRRSTGELLLTYRTALSHSQSGVNGVLNMKRSWDNGETWGAATQVLAVSGRDLRVGIVRELNDLTLAMASFHATAGVDDSTVQYLTSSDGGLNWVSNPVQSPYTLWTATECPPIQMLDDDAHLLLAVQGKSTGDAWSSSKILESVDAGVNWSVIASFTSPTFYYGEPFLQLLSDGRLLCLIRGGDDNIYATESLDAGGTWSSPVSVFKGKSRPFFIELPGEILRAIVRWSPTQDCRYIDHDGLDAASASWGINFHFVDARTIQTYADGVLLPESHGPQRLLAVWGEENVAGNRGYISQARLGAVARQV